MWQVEGSDTCSLLLPLSDGRLTLKLKTPWRNGTTHVVFEPLELMEIFRVRVQRAARVREQYGGEAEYTHDFNLGNPSGA